MNMEKNVYIQRILPIILIVGILMLNIQTCVASNSHILTTKGAYTIMQDLSYWIKAEDRELKFIGNCELPNGEGGQEYLVTSGRLKILFTCTSSGYPVLITAVFDPIKGFSTECAELGYDIICSIDGGEPEHSMIREVIKQNIYEYIAESKVGRIYITRTKHTYYVRGRTLDNGCRAVAVFVD